jgi:predicted RecA/RadA family phage recombinase
MAAPTTRRVSGDGTIVKYYPTAGAVSAGAVVVINSNCFCADSDIAQNTLGNVSAGNEVREFPKGSGALNIGVEAYWDAGNQQATSSSSGNTTLNGCFVAKPEGVSATEAAATADTTVYVARR